MDDAGLDLADHRTHAMAREVCDQLLVEVHHANSAAASVWRNLVEQRGRVVGIDEVAEKLAMSTRALLRKLETEGTSYRQLRAEARTRLAVEYLRNTRMTHEEIA